MPIDDREKSDTRAGESAPTGEERPTPEPSQSPRGRRRRRYITRRNAFIAGLALGVGIIALVLIAVLIYRLGYLDRYVASQIKGTFATYGIRAEIKNFHATVPLNTVEMQSIELYDAQSGAKLGKIDRLLATVRIQDLYALNLRRNIDLRDLLIEGLEVWATFDEQGRSNFRNIHIPPPEPNRRILFAYSTAHIAIKDSLIHYGDAAHRLAGDARNVTATIQPDNPNAPTESWMNTVTLTISNSTFIYDGRPVNNIDIEAGARV